VPVVLDRYRLYVQTFLHTLTLIPVQALQRKQRMTCRTPRNGLTRRIA